MPRSKNETEMRASIAFFDTDLNYDSESFDVTVSAKLEKLAEVEFVTGRLEDVGAGADWPAIVLELVRENSTAIMALGVFFSGKRIKENCAAWTELYKDVIQFKPSSGFANSTAAAALVLGDLGTHDEAQEFRLLGYRQFERFLDFEFAEDAVEQAYERMKTITDIGPERNSDLHGNPIHGLRFLAGEEEFIAIVDGKEVALLVSAN